ncbi:hypothetical protein GCM10029964_061550 [Kibdelosporangium lantanae]
MRRGRDGVRVLARLLRCVRCVSRVGGKIEMPVKTGQAQVKYLVYLVVKAALWCDVAFCATVCMDAFL